MGPTWGRQDLGGPHVGPMNLAVWVVISKGTYGKSKYKVLELTEKLFERWKWYKNIFYTAGFLAWQHEFWSVFLNLFIWQYSFIYIMAIRSATRGGEVPIEWAYVHLFAFQGTQMVRQYQLLALCCSVRGNRWRAIAFLYIVYITFNISWRTELFTKYEIYTRKRT